MQQQAPAFKQGTCVTTSRHHKHWRVAHVELVRRTGLQKEETSVILDRHLFLLNIQGNSERGDYVLDGKKTAFVPRRPGALMFIPAGCQLSGWEVGAPSAAYLSISVDPAYVESLFASTVAAQHRSFSPDLGFEDDSIMTAARGIGAEVQGRSPLSGMLVEAYVAAMFVGLMRRQQHRQHIQKGGLAAAGLSRIVQKIDDDLSETISLTQLADVVGLSVPHFCRAFKQSFGCPPYEFIIKRRVERAKQYLRASEMPITSIALSCGFSSSSHFSNTFRREVGASPAAYRASWSGH